MAWSSCWRFSKQLKVQLGAVGMTRQAKAKVWVNKVGTIVGKLAGSAAGMVSEQARDTVESGIGCLTRLLEFGEQDFKEVPSDPWEPQNHGVDGRP